MDFGNVNLFEILASYGLGVLTLGFWLWNVNKEKAQLIKEKNALNAEILSMAKASVKVNENNVTVLESLAGEIENTGTTVGATVTAEASRTIAELKPEIEKNRQAITGYGKQ